METVGLLLQRHGNNHGYTHQGIYFSSHPLTNIVLLPIRITHTHSRNKTTSHMDKNKFVLLCVSRKYCIVLCSLLKKNRIPIHPSTGKECLSINSDNGMLICHATVKRGQASTRSLI